MADEQRRLRVSAEDMASGPLGQIQRALRNLATDKAPIELRANIRSLHGTSSTFSRSFSEGLRSAATTVGGAFAAPTGAVVGFATYTYRLNENVRNLGNLSDRLTIAPNVIQGWISVGKQFGLTEGQVTSGLQAIRDAFRDAKDNTIGPFTTWLHRQPQEWQRAFDPAIQAAKRGDLTLFQRELLRGFQLILQSKDPSQARQILEELGLGDWFAMIMRLGPGAVERAQATGRAVGKWSEEVRKASKAFDDQNKILNDSVTRLENRYGPAVIGFGATALKAINDFFTDHPVEVAVEKWEVRIQRLVDTFDKLRNFDFRGLKELGVILQDIGLHLADTAPIGRLIREHPSLAFGPLGTVTVRFSGRLPLGTRSATR